MFFKKRPILKSFFVLNAGSLLSKLTGFVKIPMTLTYLGKSGADTLISSDKIGQLLTLLFISGTLYNAVLPITARVSRQNEKLVNNFLSLSLLGSALLIATLSVLAAWNVEVLVTWFVDPQTLQKFTPLELSKFYFTTRILLITPTILAVQTFASAYLSVKNVYTSVAVAGLISNLTFLISLIVSGRDYTIAAWGIVLGITLSTMLIVLETFRSGFYLDFGKTHTSQNKRDLRKLVTKALPRTVIVDPVNVCLLLIIPLKDFDGQIVIVDTLFSILLAFSFITTAYTTTVFPGLSTLNSLTPQARKHLLKKISDQFFKISLMQFLISIGGGIVLVFLYGYLANLGDLEGYLLRLFLYSTPIILLGLYREYVQQIYFALEDNLVIGVTTSANFLMIATAFLLSRFGLDSGYSVILAYFVFHVLWLAFSIPYLRRKHDVAIFATK